MKNHLSLIIAAAVIAGLSGCGSINAGVSAGTNYLTGAESATKANIQKVDDLNLKSITDAICATPYGAVVRNATGNPKTPSAVMDLCGLPQGVTIVTTNPTVTIATGSGTVNIPTSTTTAVSTTVAPK